ncbi:uncharacterized protein VTP21DRAFT_11303 [Calcarisporiella thermophila]|uniref:uncharacterized protein n=1 Tax=Calcarisporiella thermophila TaxID=911321 RepID=UPI0037443EE2
MSADLVWQIIKANNSFLVKRAGVEFSSEPGNLKNLNSYKYSGLANEKVVSIEANASGKGAVLSTKKKGKANHPSKGIQKAPLTKGIRRSALSVTNVVARSGYRPDLHKAALARVSAIYASQKPKKTLPAKKVRGARAAAAATKQE